MIGTVPDQVPRPHVRNVPLGVGRWASVGRSTTLGVEAAVVAVTRAPSVEWTLPLGVDPAATHFDRDGHETPEGENAASRGVADQR